MSGPSLPIRSPSRYRAASPRTRANLRKSQVSGRSDLNVPRKHGDVAASVSVRARREQREASISEEVRRGIRLVRPNEDANSQVPRSLAKYVGAIRRTAREACSTINAHDISPIAPGDVPPRRRTEVNGVDALERTQVGEGAVEGKDARGMPRRQRERAEDPRDGRLLIGRETVPEVGGGEPCNVPRLVVPHQQDRSLGVRSHGGENPRQVLPRLWASVHNISEEDDGRIGRGVPGEDLLGRVEVAVGVAHEDGLTLRIQPNQPSLCEEHRLHRAKRCKEVQGPSLPEIRVRGRLYMSDVQCGHRDAPRGICVRQRGHSFVVGAAASAFFCIRLYARTRRNMTNATMRNVITVLMNAP